MDIKEIINSIKNLEENKILEIISKFGTLEEEIKSKYVSKEDHESLKIENSNLKKEIEKLNYRINIIMRSIKNN